MTEDSSSNNLKDTGTIEFTDVDLSDGHTASVVGSSGNKLGGTVTLSSVNENNNASTGTVDWSYSVPNSASQYLAKNQTTTESFTVTVSDGNGGTVQQVITVTLKGSNDGVTVVASKTDAIGAVTEDAQIPTLTDTGVIAYNDVDLIDVHTATITSKTGSLGGSLALSVSELSTTPDGTVSWTYSLPNTSANYLAKGQTAIETFEVTINDNQGSSVKQSISVTVTGANDTPLINAVLTDSLGNITEDASIPTLSDSGLIAFSDVDLSDSHTVSAVKAGGTLGGTLTLGAVSEAANAANGTVGWTYSLPNTSAQYLAKGQTATESFTVTVNDGNGGTVSETVRVTVVGTNDTPTITLTGSDFIGAVTEGTSIATLSDSGVINFNDADLIDVHAATVIGKTGTLGGSLWLHAHKSDLHH